MLARSLTAIVICFMLTAGSWHDALPARPAMPYLVVIVMDGFRPDYETLAPMKHLHALMARGMTYDTAWVGQMESETPTGHATIATGVYPRKHSVVGFGWRDISSGRFIYMPTDLRQIRAGDLTRTIELGGVPTISDAIHQHDRSDITVSMSGEKYYASAALGAGADYVFYGKVEGKWFRPVVISPSVPPASSHFMSVRTPDSTPDWQDRFSTSLAIQLARTLHPRALLVNLPGADIGGHLYGSMADTRDMTPIIKGDDWAIGRIVQAYHDLGLLDKTIFVVTADHGMASNHHIVPIRQMYRTVFNTIGQSLDEEFRITVGSIWLRDPTRAPQVASVMAAQRFPSIDGALYKTMTPGGPTFVPDPSTAKSLSPSLLRAYTDLANTEAGPSGPDVLLPYAEDTTGLVVKDRKLWGSHGGFSWGVQHIPLIIAGPGVRPGTSHFPAKLVDVAPTMERLLGLPISSGVDGVVLADAISHSTPDERTAQHAVRSGRLADVTALRVHSLAQSARNAR